MKKLLLLAAFGVVGMMSAKSFNNVRILKLSGEKELVTQTNQEEGFFEYKIVTKNGRDNCYERYCTTTSSTSDSGVTTEHKTCSDWYEVPCPTPGPVTPAIS